MGHEEIKVPPQNLEAEKAVLGAMLIDEEAIGVVIERLDSSFFMMSRIKRFMQRR